MIERFSSNPDGELVPYDPVLGVVPTGCCRWTASVWQRFYASVATCFTLALTSVVQGGADLTVLASFAAPQVMGDRLVAPVIIGQDGYLYGTAEVGGLHSKGTVFKVRQNGGGFQVIHHFGEVEGVGNSPGDGAFPQAPVLQASDGLLYGTTFKGGTNYWEGTLFRLKPDGGSYQVLRHFGGILGGDELGSEPQAGVVEGLDGALYGTTPWGGTADGFTVYRIKRDGSGYRVLLSLPGIEEGTGATMAGLIVDDDGVLYGTSPGRSRWWTADGGMIFRLNPDGSGFKVLHQFSVDTRSSGISPQAPLFEGSDGLLYGTTRGGGTWDGGTVFRITKNGGGFLVLHSFGPKSTDGFEPMGSLTEGLDGKLYGTTTESTNLAGSIYRMKRDGTDYVSLRFSYELPWIVGSPYAGLIVAPDGAFYGTCPANVFRLALSAVFTRVSLTSSGVSMEVSGVPTQNYRMHATTNLNTGDGWQTIGNQAAGGDGRFCFTDLAATNLPGRFYRVAEP